MDELFKRQLEEHGDEFRKMLSILCDKNPFYTDIKNKTAFDLKYDDINRIYEELPILTKKDILDIGELYFTPTDEKVFAEMTSGSTGQVLNCMKTASERVKLAISIWNERRRIDSQVTIRNLIDLFSFQLEGIIGHFYEVSEERVTENFYKIMNMKPRWLSGPISLINKFSCMIIDGKINYRNDGSLKYIEFTGEYNNENTVRQIEKIFNCRTVNYYGTRETWCVAYECNQRKLHVQNYMMCDIFPTERGGRLLLTSLCNIHMPFIKYDIGDIAKLDPYDCECGNKNPVINLSGGRTTDLITGRNILGNYFFDQVLWEACEKIGTHIYEMQIEQAELDVFNIYIIKGIDYNTKIEKLMSDRMRKELGDSIQINYIYSEQLKPLKNGKVKKFYPYQGGR